MSGLGLKVPVLHAHNKDRSYTGPSHGAAHSAISTSSQAISFDIAKFGEDSFDADACKDKQPSHSKRHRL